VYCKPYVGDEEQRRIDFGVFNEMAEETEESLVCHLRRVLREVDAVILNQQLARGISSPSMIQRLNELIHTSSGQRVFLVDSRDRSERYVGAHLKLNAYEAARLCGEPVDPEQTVSPRSVSRFAERIFARTGQPVFITMGERGCVVFDGTSRHEVSGVRINGPTDPVGAGDTFVSALAASMAVGATAYVAAQLANLAAAVTVRKLKQTGTATPEEILGIASTS